jgi:micrococcal nuclease
LANETRTTANAQPSAAQVNADAAPVAAAQEVDGRTWVVAVNGDCPDGYPVKANANSGIFHVLGGRFYARTVADRCYANADDALADGYRPAKA